RWRSFSAYVLCSGRLFALPLGLGGLGGHWLVGHWPVSHWPVSHWPPGRLLRFCRLLLQTLQRALLLDRPFAISLRHRLLPLGGAHRRTPPRPRSRARRGLASS